MKTYFVRLVKHSFIYGLGQLASQAVGFLLIPIYTRYFSLEEYGALAILTLSLSLLTMFLDMGMGSALFRYYFDSTDEQKRAKIISTGFVFLFFLSLCVCSLLVAFAPWVSKIILENDRYQRHLIYLSLTAFLNTLGVVPFAYLRAREESVTYSLISFFKFLVNLTLNIYFVVILKRNALGVMESGLIASLSTIIILVVVARHIRFHPSWKVFKNLFLFGVPLMPTQLAGWILGGSNRFFLQRFLSLDDVGVFTLGYRLGFLINMLIVMPFSVAWAPFMYTVAKSDKAKEIYSRLMTFFTSGIIMMGIGLCIFSKEIVQILAPPAYSKAYQVVPFVVFSYCLYGMYFILTAGLNIQKKTYFFPMIVGFSAVANLLLNYLMIPTYGILGAGISMLLSYLLMSFLTFVFSQRYYYIKYEYIKIIKILILPVLICPVVYRCTWDSWKAWLLKSALFIGSIFVFWMFGIFNKYEIKRIFSIFEKLVRIRRSINT
jgi:O-antigen/teichoic acid export membrane protein